MAPTGLSIRRIIRAPRKFVFEAWTTPALLMQWWGPAGVECTDAEVDLREGGHYRIANRRSDGEVIWISGIFEHVRPPEELVYSWSIGMPGTENSRVRVEFRAHPEGTELLLTHERFEAAVRDMHLEGWNGCLDGLEAFVEARDQAG